LATLLDEPLYLAAGGAVVLLGGVGLIMARRRRNAEREDDAAESERIAPTFGGRPSSDSTDWNGESTIERAAARADTVAPPALDTKPAPAMHTTPPEASVRRPPTASEDNDLDFETTDRQGTAAALTTQPDKPSALASGASAIERASREPTASAQGATRDPEAVSRITEREPMEPLTPDFASAMQRTPSSDAPSAATAREPQANEFELEPLPPINAPMDAEKVSSEPPPSVDFKLDLNDLDINAPARGAGAADRDDHWHDVQQKFDLAKAYEEMGDKGGARDILQEVMREGDHDQQAQAKKLLDTLS
jgi:pilus assembly protein FimV